MENKRVSKKILMCPITEACQDISSWYQPYTCGKYYTGNLCNECREGFAKKSLSSECTNCSLHFASHFTWFLILSLLYKLIYSEWLFISFDNAAEKTFEHLKILEKIKSKDENK